MKKTVLITGGNSGIGKATAIGLARAGYEVVIAYRDRQRGLAAVEEIKKASGHHQVELLEMDLSSFKSVRSAADRFKQDHPQLHVLINNAAVFLKNREETEDGFEKTFQTNYLSHFLLTHLLLPTLKASAPSRIINVATKHFGIKINFDDLQTTKNYSYMKAVGPSKLGLIMFTKALAKQLEGTKVTVNSLHPGLAQTNLLHQMSAPVKFVFKLISASPEKSAETSIYLATATEVEGISGQYFENKKAVKTGSNANSEEAINRLWDLSVEMTKPS